MAAPQVEGSAVKELKASPSDNHKQTIIIYEEEDDVQGNISSYLKEIDQMESTLAELTNDFPKSVQLKQNKHNEKIAKTKRKITNLFKDTNERLKQKEQKLLHELDQIKNNTNLKLDPGDVIIDETKQKLSKMHKYLERNLNVWNNKILSIFTSDIEYIYNEHEYNGFMNNCDCFGKIVTGNEKNGQNRDQEKEEKQENNEVNVANELQNKEKITQKPIYWIFNIVFVVWYLWSQVWFETRYPIHFSKSWTHIDYIVVLVIVFPLYLMIFHLCISSGLTCTAYTAVGQWTKYVLIIIGNLIFVEVLSIRILLSREYSYKLLEKYGLYRMEINSSLIVIYLSDVVFICFMHYVHRKYCVGNKFIAAIGSIMALMISYQLLNNEFGGHFERIISDKAFSIENFVEPHGMMYLWYLGVLWFVDCN